MGLIYDFGKRFVLHRTSRVWGESTAFLLAVGLATGCAPRAEPPSTGEQPTNPSVTTSASPAATGPESNTAVSGEPHLARAGEITATSTADGRTYLHLAPLPDLLEGDLIHIQSGGRMVGMALVTALDATKATALVTGITDRTRPVLVGDQSTPVTLEELAPVVTAAAPESSAATELTAPAVAGETGAHETSKDANLKSGNGHSTVTREDPTLTTASTAAAVRESSPSTGLTPEVRARLNAERAYFELATRVLRLPAAGPELSNLQTRLRDELAALETLP